MKISACWISKNEESEIQKSIESVKGIADELIVVDTGSTDNTCKIAEESGARVLHFKWVDSFAAAKNYALDNADGDIIIFLDADEYFNPSLGDEHKSLLESEFLNSGFDAIVSIMDNIDRQLGTFLNSGHTVRLFKGKGKVRYAGSIHERLIKQNGSIPSFTDYGSFNVTHTGYSSLSSKDKTQRNLSLLKSSVEKNNGINEEKAIDMCYILREANLTGDNKAAVDALKWLLENYSFIKDIHARLFQAGLIIGTWGVVTAQKNREYFSREQINDILVEGLPKYSKRYENISIQRLGFSRKFRFIDREIINKINSIDTVSGETVNQELVVEKEELYLAAGRAAEKRQNRALMFDNCSKAIILDENSKSKDSFTMFFRAVAGLAEADIIQFFESNIKPGNIGVMNKLIGGCQASGQKKIFLYYCMKAYKARLINSFNYSYMLTASGKFEESIKYANENIKDEEMKKFLIYLAIICSKSIALLNEYSAGLGMYSKVAEAYLNNEKLKNTGKELEDIIKGTYERLLFINGFNTADNFLHMFEGAEELCFDLKYEKYSDYGRYSEFLRQNAFKPEEKDSKRLMKLVDISVLAANYTEAFNIISRFIFREDFSYELFNNLDIIRGLAGGELAKEADSLYEKYFASYDEFIDYNDIVNTGYVAYSDNLKQKKALQRMKVEEFERWLIEEKPFTIKAYMNVCFKAAEKLEAAESYYKAFECYFKLLAAKYNEAEVSTALSVLFEKAGNSVLAEYLRSRQ